MNEGEKTLLQLSAAIGIAAVAIVPAILWQAYVGNVLWGWFVTPITGIVAPGMALLFGLFTFARMIGARMPADTHSEKKPAWERTISATLFLFFYPAFALFAGWVTVQFV